VKKWTVIVALALAVLYTGFKVLAWQIKSAKAFQAPIRVEVLGPFWIIGHATPGQEDKAVDAEEREFRDQLLASGVVATVSPGNAATSSEKLSGTPVSREVFNRLKATGRYRGIRIRRQRCLVARHAMNASASKASFPSKMIEFVRETARSASLVSQMTRELEARKLHVPRTVFLIYTSPDPSGGISIVCFAPLEQKD
jgi:hypothetical protein